MPASGKFNNGRGARQVSNAPYQNNSNRKVQRKQNGNTKLFIGNLSWNVRWQDLKDHFKQCGEVVFADVLMERGSNRSKGVGIIEFANAADAELAIETLNESELDGRNIVVNYDEKSQGSSNTNTRAKEVSHASNGSNARVFVGNLDWSVNWQVLKTYLAQYGGSLEHVDVPVNDQGKSRGFGIAEYSNPADADEIIRLVHDSMLNGRPMIVRLDREDGEPATVRTGVVRVTRNRTRSDSLRSDSHTTSDRIFISNLPFETTWQELKDFCRRAGEPTFAEIPSHADGKSRGFGIVAFSTVEEAGKAIDILNNGVLRGRNVNVRADRPKQ